MLELLVISNPVSSMLIRNKFIAETCDLVTQANNLAFVQVTARGPALPFITKHRFNQVQFMINRIQLHLEMIDGKTITGIVRRGTEGFGGRNMKDRGHKRNHRRSTT